MRIAGSAGYRPSWRQSFLAPAKLIIVVCIRHAYNTTKTLEELKQLETAELNAMGSVMSKVCTYCMPHGWHHHSNLTYLPLTCTAPFYWHPIHDGCSWRPC